MKDTGIGIAFEKMDAIFERFQQADEDTTRKYGGTGLGLTLVKRYLQMHGGTIHVKSQPGHGSDFTFVLPRRLG